MAISLVGRAVLKGMQLKRHRRPSIARQTGACRPLREWSGRSLMSVPSAKRNTTCGAGWQGQAGWTKVRPVDVVLPVSRQDLSWPQNHTFVGMAGCHKSNGDHCGSVTSSQFEILHCTLWPASPRHHGFGDKAYWVQMVNARRHGSFGNGKCFQSHTDVWLQRKFRLGQRELHGRLQHGAHAARCGHRNNIHGFRSQAFADASSGCLAATCFASK